MPTYRVIRPFVDRETGQRREPGELIEVDAERGERLLAALVVTEVNDAPAPETAARAPRETAARRRGRARA